MGYRYDGLYMVGAVWDVDGHETESFPVAGENGWQTYFFTRVPKKPLEKEKVEAGMEYNAMGLQELWGTVQKMKGVRKPKKFEIPQPPVKLPPVKRTAISGVYKDRKCVGYKRPEPPAAPKPPPPMPKPQQTARSRSPRNIPKQLEDLSSDSSSVVPSDDEEEEEQQTQKRQTAIKEDVSSSDSDSDTLHAEQQQNKRTSSLSAGSGSPSKVLTPRPRMNSVSHHQPKKPSPAANHNDDSSESEEESIPSVPAKRVRKPSPKKKLLNATFDSSAYFPKRASAARAEAANRDMLGSQRSYNRRKASETTAAATKSSAPSRPTRVSGRKRTKMQYDDVDDSSSEEEAQDPNAVDQSILTIGSRVLVLYKGQLFKATIRKRRFKNESHDFLIHYDGNKRTNVHWIPLDNIDKILEINVDSPPKKKAKAPPPPRKKGGNNNKRKAPAQTIKRQESLQNSHYDGKDEGETAKTAAKQAKSNDDCSEKRPKTSSENGGKSTNEIPNAEAENAGGDQFDSKRQKGKVEDVVVHSENGDAGRCVEPINPKSDDAPIAKDEMDVEESKPAANLNITEQNAHNIRKPTTSNMKTTTTGAASARKPRQTVVTDVELAKTPKMNEADMKDPLQVLAEEAGSDIDDTESSKDSDDNSASSSGNAKQVQAASEPTSEFKYQVGGHVYVEYRHIFYSSTILKTRRKRSATEYLVHYEGYKKSSNRWVKESALHEVNAVTTQRFEEQRLIPADILYESGHPAEFGYSTRRKKASESSDPASLSSSGHSAAMQKKPPPRRMRSDASETGQAALEKLEPGVDFLPGSMVFVEWSELLYLAKMVKKRYSGDRTEYLISYDGYKSIHDSWVSIRKIYEVNPQSKRVFKKLNSEVFLGSNAGDDKPKQRPAPPVSKRRETRKKTQDYDDIASYSSAEPSKLRNNGDSKQPPSSRSQTSRTTSSLDMKGIEAGVEFLPGSQLFAEYKGGLCLAKMLKKRGKGDYMEYLIQYTGLKKAKEAWVSTALVYEINPQTKRMFRQLSNN